MTVSSVAAVQARIAEIQARFAPTSSTPDAGAAVWQQLSAASTSPAAPRSRAGGTAFTSMAAAGTPSPLQAPDPAWARGLPAAGQPWAPAIGEAAERHGLDPRLLASLVWTESDFQPDAVSRAGAIGLAQLMPGTAAGLGVDPHDPAANLDGGARYLREQLDRFGRVDLALAAYNAGPGRVAQAGGVPHIAETQAYVRRVLSHLESLT